MRSCFFSSFLRSRPGFEEKDEDFDSFKCPPHKLANNHFIMTIKSSCRGGGVRLHPQLTNAPNMITMRERESESKRESAGEIGNIRAGESRLSLVNCIIRIGPGVSQSVLHFMALPHPHPDSDDGEH